jgi:hypothetical protein
MKRALLTGLITLAATTTAAIAADEPFDVAGDPSAHVFGHNGAWTLSTNDVAGSCAMSTAGTTDTGARAEFSIDLSKYGINTGVATNESQPIKGYLATVTDKVTGETVITKPLQKVEVDTQAGVQWFVGSLTMPEVMRLLSLSRPDASHIITIRYGKLSFDINIRGGMAAYQNVKSCAA